MAAKKKDTPLTRVAKSRLKMELAGLAFAMERRATPFEYARHLWSRGAVKWMGKEGPFLREYMEKEAEAFSVLYPWLEIEMKEMSPDRIEIRFKGGCLGGWGEDRWALARGLGLDPKDICSCFGQAFKAWPKQLGLRTSPHPGRDWACKLVGFAGDQTLECRSTPTDGGNRAPWRVPVQDWSAAPVLYKSHRTYAIVHPGNLKMSGATQPIIARNHRVLDYSFALTH